MCYIIDWIKQIKLKLLLHKFISLCIYLLVNLSRQISAIKKHVCLSGQIMYGGCCNCCCCSCCRETKVTYYIYTPDAKARLERGSIYRAVENINLTTIIYCLRNTRNRKMAHSTHYAVYLHNDHCVPGTVHWLRGIQTELPIFSNNCIIMSYGRSYSSYGTSYGGLGSYVSTFIILTHTKCIS